MEVKFFHPKSRCQLGSSTEKEVPRKCLYRSNLVSPSPLHLHNRKSFARSMCTSSKSPMFLHKTNYPWSIFQWLLFEQAVCHTAQVNSFPLTFPSNCSILLHKRKAATWTIINKDQEVFTELARGILYWITSE